MKVLLIRPPYTDFQGTEPPRVGIPLGTLSVASSMEKRGHLVKVFDSLVHMDRTEDDKHFGASWEKIKGVITEYRPHVIGITNLFSTQLEKALILPNLIKEIDPEIKIIVGGPHATVRPQDFLNTGKFDIAIIAEGEISGADILDYYEGKKKLSEISGIAYLEKGKIKINQPQYIQDLDQLPIPAYHLVDMEMYFNMVFNGFSSRPQDPFQKPKREITMITSRGCPYICTFCSIHPTMGYKYRIQSAEYVANHIEFLVKNYNVELIHFEDDNLTLNPTRFEKILDLLYERSINFEWDTPNGVRADTLNRHILEKMKRSNVSELRIAIESGVQEILDNVVKKSLDLKKAVEAAKNCYELGIRLAAFYVIGMPGETKENINTTLNLAYNLMKHYNVIPHVNIANPLVGTELYNTAKEKGYLINEDYTSGFIFGHGRIKTEEFDPEYLNNLTKIFYKKVRNLYLLNQFKPKNMVKNIDTFIRYPKNTIRLIKIASKYTG